MLGAAVSGVGLAASLGACGGGLDDEVRLRAVNATADVARIDLRFNDRLWAGAIANGASSSAYAGHERWASASGARFEVWPAGGGTRLHSIAAHPPTGSAASVVVMGSVASGLRLRLLDEDAPRPDGPGTKLRVLHAWPAGGALDVFVTPAGQVLTGRAPDWALQGYEVLTSHVTVQAGARLRITPRGRSDLVLFDDTSTSFGSGPVATLVVAPAVGSSRVVVAVLPQALPASVLVG